MAEDEKDRRLVRRKQGVQRTKGGLIIPIPKTEDFDNLLRKAASHRRESIPPRVAAIHSADSSACNAPRFAIAGR